jgi:uncharacterized delta-60 repeat protein
MKTTLIWALGSLGSALYAQNSGIADPSFGLNGLAGVNAFTDREEAAVCAFPLKSGKIIVMGDCDQGATGRDFALVRLQANGTVDPTFGSKSYAYQANAKADDHAFDGIVQPDGKYLLIGNTPLSAGSTTQNQTLMMRFDAEGNLDPAFGGDGKVVFDGNNGKTFAKAVALQNDGKIVVVGEYANDNTGDMLVMRFLPDGTADNQFGTGGVVHIGTVAFKDEANDVLVQPDGKIIVAGYLGQAGNSARVGVARLNANGTPDTGFGSGDGLFGISLGNGLSMALRLCLQPDGKIGLACHQSTGNVRQHVMVRLLANGTVDTAFGTNGSTVFPFGNSNDFPAGIWAQPDGKLVSVGSGVIGAQHHFVAARFLANGQPDEAFGTNGKVVRPVGSPALARHAVPVPGNPATNAVLISGNIPILNDNSIGLVKFRTGATSSTRTADAPLARFAVSPNPVEHLFQIRYTLPQPDVMTCDLYNAAGQRVHRFFDHQWRSADVSIHALSFPDHLPTGMYTLCLGSLSGRQAFAPQQLFKMP